MKKVLLFLLMAASITYIMGQEGVNYRTTKKCVEKTYDVSQKFGKDKLKLSIIAKVEYDTSGYIVRKSMTKGNLNYAGKTIINRGAEPNTWEVVNYNYLNNLQDRWVRITERDDREYTEIHYSSKGKVIFKTSVRVDSLRQHQWEYLYNELGYVPAYYEMEPDTTGLVARKIKYDYGDNPVETTIYYYNENKAPILAMTYTPADSLIGKIIYDYDASGNLLRQTSFDSKGRETNLEEWSYDDSGRTTVYNYSIFDSRFGGIPRLRQTKVYEYSSH